MHLSHCHFILVSVLPAFRRLIFVWLASALALPFIAAAEQEKQEETSFDFAPLFTYAENPDNREPQWLALGPLFEKTVYGEGEDKNALWAMPRPLYTHFTTDGGTRGGTNALWPLYFSRFRPRGSYQFLFPFIHTIKDTDSEYNTSRCWLPPVFFTGRKINGGRYYAVFPIGGSIYKLAGFDKVEFILFPLYLKAEKASITSKSYLWPVFQTVKADDFSKWRIFPLFGSKKTSQYIQRYFAWPFFHMLTPRSPETSMGGFFLFPLAGYFHKETEKSKTKLWTFLWPFFSKYQYGKDYKLHCPWPFLQFYEQTAENGVSKKSYFWPFYGTYNEPHRHYRFILWPFFRQRHSEIDDNVMKSFSFITFFSRKKLEDGQEKSSSRHLWPLYKIEKEADNSRFWTLALWPNAKGDPVARNYAPFWRIFTYSGSADKTSAQALWGLWQFKHKTDKRLETSLFPAFNFESSTKGWSFSLLKGLLSGGVKDKKPTGRILWFIRW